MSDVQNGTIKVRRAPMSPSEKAEAISMWNDGAKIQELAEKFDMATSSMYNVLRKAGVTKARKKKRRRQAPKPKTTENPNLRKMFATTVTPETHERMEKLSKNYNMSKGRILDLLVRREEKARFIPELQDRVHAKMEDLI